MSSVLAGDDSIFNNSRFKRYFFKLSAGSSGYFGGGTTRERKLEVLRIVVVLAQIRGLPGVLFSSEYTRLAATNTTPVAEDAVEVVSSYMGSSKTWSSREMFIAAEASGHIEMSTMARTKVQKPTSSRRFSADVDIRPPRW